MTEKEFTERLEIAFDAAKSRDLLFCALENENRKMDGRPLISYHEYRERKALRALKDGKTQSQGG